MVFRKSLIDAIGGMDEQFNPGYYEDTDFCIRARIYEKNYWLQMMYSFIIMAAVALKPIKSYN